MGVIRNTGLSTSQINWLNGHRDSFTLSNGNTLLIVRDTNVQIGATAPGDRDSVEKLYIYETADHVTYNLRATKTLPAGTSMIALSGALFANDDLAIAFINAEDYRTVRYCKFTYSGYTTSAWETAIAPTSPLIIDDIDIDVSDTGAVCIGALVYNTTDTFHTRLYVKATTGGAWVNTWSNTEWTNVARMRGGSAISVCCLNLFTGVRDIVIAAGASKAGASPVDTGVTLWGVRFTESSGAINGTASQRGTYVVGDANPINSVNRLARIFRTGGSSGTEFILGIMHQEMTRKFFLLKGTFNSGTWATTMSPVTINSLFSAANIRKMSMTFSKTSINMLLIVGNIAGVSGDTLVNYLAKAGSSGVYSFAPHTKFWVGNVIAESVGANGNRNNDISNHNVMLLARNTSSYMVLHELKAEVTNPGNASAIFALTPTHNSEIDTSNPTLIAKVDTNEKYSQLRYKVQFQFATDTSFASNLVDYVQPDSKLAKVDGTNIAGTSVGFNDFLPSTFTLNNGIWYYRARLVNEFGQTGLWSSTQTIIVGHSPTPIQISPVDSQMYVYGSGQVNFVWMFTDTSLNDFQTAYQIILTNTEDGSVLLDTGKVVSASEVHSHTVSTTYKNKLLSWAIRLWDSEDVAGEYKTTWFILIDSPTATINSPTTDQVLSTGVPTINFTVTAGGTRKIKSYNVGVFQNGELVWSSGNIAGPFDSGTTHSVRVDPGYLLNNNSYSVQVSVADDGNNIGVSTFVPFSIAWTPPAAPTGVSVSTTYYNTEDEGYVLLTWNDTARDVDFRGWAIYRKDDLIDPNTQTVLEEGVYKLIYTDYDTGLLYQYKDYFAPSNYLVSYLIKQNVNRDGQDIDSDNTVGTSVIPQSDGYWLIEPTTDNTDADAFKLSIIVGDSFTEEQEVAEFSVIGRGRVINKGQDLGVKGTLEAQIRNTIYSTARQKRLRLKSIQDNNGQLWMRNPFGDIFKVHVSNMSISRIAGVGTSEFVDISIPYSEVV